VKTLADLRAIKEKAKQNMASREKTAKYRIIVSMGTCGIAAGARATMSAIIDELNKRNIKDAIVTQTGCLGYCDQEPMIQISQASKQTITYGKVTPEIAREIITGHVVNNKVLTNYVFNLS
jgi:NADP-reducing hydrogenase subunit HndB